MSDNADAVVLFGVTGDLAYKKLLPALYHIVAKGRFDGPIVGMARSDWDTEDLREQTRKAVGEAETSVDADALEQLVDALTYVRGEYAEPESYERLARALNGAERPLFYLSIPPKVFDDVIGGLRESGLNRNSRLIVEKPFGRDLESAQALDETLYGAFHEAQIFRIDHFLGKEPVQNLLVFRFANNLFEPVWNRHHIRSVQITLAEDFGVEGRGGFFEGVGTLRDVVQNHLLQIVCLLAMEPPLSAETSDLRDEILKVLRAVRPVDPQSLVRGQFAGYRDEPGVAADSDTETFVALQLQIDNYRWAGVPFAIRAGKMLESTVTEAIVEFHRPPHQLFHQHNPEGNRLRFRMKPDDTISLSIQAKPPGEELASEQVELEVSYSEELGGAGPEAYERLLTDAIRGNQRLFARQDAVEQAWRIVDPALRNPPPVTAYDPGTWGPEEAESIIPGRRGWIPCGRPE
jgi:glucose-6-phosphate 1-dehydrogenase